MKILHIGKYYQPIEGGIESINHIVVDALAGYQQRIISFNNRNVSVEEDIDNVSVVRAASLFTIASQPVSIKYYKEIRRAIKLFQPDIVHFHYPNPLGALYLLLSITKFNKLIVHWHSDIVSQKLIKPLLYPIDKLLLRKANAIIATSPLYIESSNLLLKHKDKINIIPCSINESNFTKKVNDDDEITKIRNRYNNKPIILFVGRHVEYKGIKYLLQAEDRIKSDCILLIAGKGPLTDTLKKQYKSNRIVWLGKISNDKMRQLMYAASIFAFPSVTRNEAFGVALAEAMFCGCPTVTFSIDGSGVNWVSLNQETGIVVPNADVQSFAEAIDELLNNKAKREVFGTKANLRVKKLFTKEAVKSQYLDLYNRVFKS